MIHKSIIAVFFASFISSFLCLAQQPDAKSILIGAAAALERHHSVEYTATMKRTTASLNDTIICTGKVDLIRDTNDQAFGGKYIFTTIGDTASHDEITWLYDLNLAYTINNRSKTATSMDLHHPEHGVVFDIRDKLLWRNFLRPNRIHYLLGDTLIFIGEKYIDDAPCNEIEIRMPPFGNGDNLVQQTTWLYVTQKDSIPILQQWLDNEHGSYIYSELFIKGYQFDDVSDIGLTPEMRASYTFTPFDPDPDLYKTLDSNAPAPQICGRVYQHHLDSISISYKDKVTLLDFWYQDCGWCIRSFPDVEKLHEKYKNMPFQLYGVNSIDTDKRNLQRLVNFFHFNTMSYNTIIVSNDIPKAFSCKGCPSYYIIDKHGKIAYSQVGYSDDLYVKLDRVISRLLKQ